MREQPAIEQESGPKLLLTIEGAARALSGSTAAVHRLLREGELHRVRIPRLGVRVRADEVLALIDRHTEDAASAHLPEPDRLDGRETA